MWLINLDRLNNETDFEYKLRLCRAKLDKDIDLDWGEIADILGLDVSADHLRKTAYGMIEASNYYNNKSYAKTDDLDVKLADIRKERMKLQTANLERTRIERSEARHELYYEYLAQTIEALPIPEFNKLYLTRDKNEEYVLCLADIHYGAKFQSANNEYSPEICKARLEYLAHEVIDFVNERELNTIHILCLGDVIQGILRVSDLKINDSSVVRATVEISRLLAQFITLISQYTNVEYYHVPSANHTQTRPLGTKASELADEDLEYVISNYIKDLVRDNERINVNLAPEGSQYLEMNIAGFDIITGHGHTLKGSKKNSLKNLSIANGKNYSYAIFGHFHGGDMFTSHESSLTDCEVITAPSFIGSDPYSDSLFVGSKAASIILGFDRYDGHIDTHKIILNN